MKPDRKQLAELVRQLAATAPVEIDCEVVLDRVAAYLEAARGRGELPQELRQVEQHLAVCPSCLEEYQALLRSID